MVIASLPARIISEFVTFSRIYRGKFGIDLTAWI
jgi:hypothetical protein